MHELRDAFVFGELAEGEDGFLLYCCVGVVFDGGGNGGAGFLAGLLLFSVFDPVHPASVVEDERTLH